MYILVINRALTYMKNNNDELIVKVYLIKINEKVIEK